MTSRINDHNAMTEERREQVENTAYMIALAMENHPGMPAPQVDGEMLIDAVKHIGVLDRRNRNFGNIIRAFQKQMDGLEEVLAKIENPQDMPFAPLDEIYHMLQSVFQGALQESAKEEEN